MDGLILDPFAGTGTSGHAALDLNQKDGGDRKFILIEKGEGKDRIAQRLLAKRLKAVILGQWADKKQHQPLKGGFKF
jgi:adenine-specific DNA-methyltransferase